MNNYEKIKAMNIDKMAEFLQDRNGCDNCICELDENTCMAIGCNDGIKKWLESEVENE